MRIVGRYLRPYTRRMCFQLFMKLSSTVVELLLPGMLSKILDVYAANGDTSGVWKMGILMFLCAVLAWGGNCWANKMATGISRDFIIELRHDLFVKTLSLSNAQRDRITEASLNSRLTSDTYYVHNMVDRMQRLGIRAPILLLGGIIVALMLDVRLTLVLICCLPFLAATLIVSSKKGVPLFTQVQEAQDLMVRKIQENMAGARVIRAMSKTFYEQNAFGKINDELAHRQKKADMTMAAVSPITGLILNAGLAIVVLVGAWLVNRNQTLPGTIVAFLSYFTIILNSLLMLSRMFVMWSKGSASARRIEAVMNLPEDRAVQPISANAGSSAETPHVSFRQVGFSYNKTYQNVSDISFDLYHGQTLGIIGPTGSGKSTLLSLLLRQYDIDEGEILINGRSVSSIPDEELLRHVGVVFQNDFLMADTLRENIAFGRSVSDNDITRAVACAQADFVYEKEGGLDYRLNVKGRNLSGGQQQRVLISRALSDNPELLLFDDCSSALDYRTDLQLRREIREQFANTTTIIVTQRVSAVMAADQILVMEKGKIIGRGTHAQLLQSCDTYRNLCRLQLGDDAA